MAEAAEVGHWNVLEVLNGRARHAGLGELIRWVKPIEKRHFEEVLAGSKTLAGEEGPDDIA